MNISSRINYVKYKYVILLIVLTTTISIGIIQTSAINPNKLAHTTKPERQRVNIKTLIQTSAHESPIWRKGKSSQVGSVQHDNSLPIFPSGLPKDGDQYYRIGALYQPDQTDDIVSVATNNNHNIDSDELNGDQLSFKLMSSGKERIAAVKSLLQNDPIATSVNRPQNITNATQSNPQFGKLC